MPLKWAPINLPNLPLVEGVVRLAKEYDPETQVVVLFLHPDGSQAAYRVCWHPTPPEAYEERKRHLM